MKKAITNFFTKAKEKATKCCAGIKKNALAVTTSIATIIPMASTMNVFATTTGTEDALIKNVLNVIFNIFRYIGILLLAWSIGMLVLAFKNEDADSKSRAIMMIVVSVVLIGIKTVFTGLNIAGFSSL